MTRIIQQIRRMRFLIGLFLLLAILEGLFLVVIFGWIDFSGWADRLDASNPIVQAGWVSPTASATWIHETTPLSPGNQKGGLQEGQFTRSPTPFQPSTYTPTATVTPTPTPTPTPTATFTATPTVTPSPTATEILRPTALPDSAQVRGVSGVNQSLSLSCESRSAVDWARFFGFKINELDFQYALPRTDNPETGFVGDPRGNEGMIPPRSYGVHAGPVADLLHTYGVPARAYKGLGLEDIRREVAEGRPVIVWVIGAVQSGWGVEYTASDGQTTIVASMEHTVMAMGYTPNSIMIQDGSYRYFVSIEQFRHSWGVLGNMAVLEK